MRTGVQPPHRFADKCMHRTPQQSRLQESDQSDFKLHKQVEATESVESCGLFVSCKNHENMACLMLDPAGLIWYGLIMIFNKLDFSDSCVSFTHCRMWHPVLTPCHPFDLAARTQGSGGTWPTISWIIVFATTQPSHSWQSNFKDTT